MNDNEDQENNLQNISNTELSNKLSEEPIESQFNSHPTEMEHQLPTQHKLTEKEEDLTTLLNADKGTNEYVERLLNGRTLHNLAEYAVCYRSRLKCPNIDITTSLGNTFYIREKSFTDLYFRDIENDTINVSLGLPDLFDNQKRTDISYTNFLHKNIYNENSRPDFKDFDKILAIIEQTRQPCKLIKQQKFDFIEDLTKKFKHLYNYGK